ncbi:MAG TPA: Hint domain-containing protein [Puia sp.]|nr:Hint domain-containing protein [Puia sp.]
MNRMMLALCLLVAGAGGLRAQDTAGVRSITMEEYEKARTFTVGDPDKDTYVKFDNVYVLDHHDFGKPYFITGDDGKRKRIDLYKLLLRQDRVELGTVIFYTTETGKRYTACLPGYRASPAVWRKYFEDIHAIDRIEPTFVLKLSYVLSEELGFQLYRAAHSQQDAATGREEKGTYGNDICFPGDMRVEMADGTLKAIASVRPGDIVTTVDPVTQARQRVRVRALTVHAAKNYAITTLMLVAASSPGAHEVKLSARFLEATPNHPMETASGEKKAGDLLVGDTMICRDAGSGKLRRFVVWDKTESAGGEQRVYNIVVAGGTTLILNGVVVMQK